ncbi:MAG: hypothetical protein J7518_03245 [Nocardioidaceae bacterium]|nr:hypothetical protein [Nocardioidaceae bacterium]
MAVFEHLCEHGWVFTPRRDPDPVPRTAPAGSAPYAPPGWPREVRPPGASGWEPSAVAWLLDQCPPEYRGYPALRRHPVLLARFARLHVEACQAAVDRGLSEARGSLRDVATRDEIAAAIEVWEREKARLLGVRRSAGLVEDALQGRRYVEALH